jgi:hypothetical protein
MMIKTIHQSHLGMFLRCPAQFERRYINGEIIPPGISARRGSATHKAAEINHKQKLTSRKDLELDSLQDAARDEYVRLVKDEGVFIPKDQVGEKDTLLAAGLDASTRLTKLYHDSLAPKIQPILAEEYLTVDAGIELPLAGTIDVLTEDNWMPDLKTADKSKSSGEADNSLQLSFYSGLVANHTGKWPEKVSLEILVNNKEPKLQSLETSRGPEHWKNLLLRVQMMIAQINTGLFPPCDPGAWICTPKWCGYFDSCKYSLKKRG